MTVVVPDLIEITHHLRCFLQLQHLFFQFPAVLLPVNLFLQPVPQPLAFVFLLLLHQAVQIDYFDLFYPAPSPAQCFALNSALIFARYPVQSYYFQTDFVDPAVRIDPSYPVQSFPAENPDLCSDPAFYPRPSQIPFVSPVQTAAFAFAETLL